MSLLQRANEAWGEVAAHQDGGTHAGVSGVPEDTAAQSRVNRKQIRGSADKRGNGVVQCLS